MPARWLLALLACLALLALGSAQAGSTDLVVGLAADAPMPQPGQTWHGMPVLKSIPPLHAIVVDAEKAPLGALPRLDGLPEVRYVAPDIREHLLPVLGAADPASGTATPAPAPLLVPGDALYGQQYGPAQVRAPAAWDTVTGNRTTAVCVVDTGVRHTHEDLQDAWRGGYDFVDDDADPWDGHSHGTHVAGIAAAGLHNGVGIAGMGNVALYGVRVLNDSGAGSYFDVAAGIVWCADEVPEPTVINLSLGGSSPHQTLQDAVEYAVGKGAIVVAAAGNSGPCTDCVGYPARYEQAIAVACTNSSESRCSFSSRGASVDIAAPGHQILSSIHSADDAYTKYSGTSMSTPHVAGALALAWQHLPALTNEQLRERLEATAQDIGYAGKDKDFGHGELDLLCLIQDNRTCSTAVLPVAPPDYDTFTACQDATDRYGYACSVHNRTYVPLGPGATPIELSNNVSAAIPIGFPFRFYDKTYDSVYISANGWVSFEPTVDPRRGPATIMPLDLELFHWAGGEVRYGLQGEAPHRTFRVEWHDILALVYDSPRYTFQIVLHEDGSVAEIEYDTIERPMYRRYDAYITDASEAFRLTFQSGAWAAKDLAVRFTHPGDGHPAKPEGVTATTPAAPRQVHVSWAAPTQGPWPTGYRVFQQDAAGKTTLLATLGNVTSTTVAVRDDVQARVRVAAFNGVGEGPMSAVATARSHAAPSVVRELSVDPDAQGGIRLSWLPPASSGGLPLQGYRVYAGFKPDFLWQLGTTTATSYQTPYSVGGPFYFSVAAYSGVDEGPPASLVCVVPAHVAVAPDCELLQPLDGRSCESQGQDLYGYTCHTRAYRYEDLASATATRLPDGREPVRVQLGFPFTFYGKTHTEAYVSPQGVLYFDRPFDAWSLRIPDAAPANNMVLVGGTLDHQREGSVHHATLGVAPARRFVVEWRDVSVGWDSSTAHVQLILHEATNEVEVQFGRMPWQAAFTVGIESPSGSTASIFAEQRTIQGMSGVRFVPPTNPLQASFLPPGASDCETPGPDRFGYTCAVVPYSFLDIASTGNRVPYEYGWIWKKDLGFDFEYYGKTYRAPYIYDDAQIIFDSPFWFFGKPYMATFPETPHPNNQVVAYTGGMEHHWGGNVYMQTVGTAPYRMFIVQWDNAAAVTWDGLGIVDLQMVLYETTNDIGINYRLVQGAGSDVAAGMEDANGKHGLLYKRGSLDMQQTSVRFSYPERGGCAKWYDVYGYRCEFPDFEWVDISTVGVPLPMESHTILGPIPLGIPYMHYGEAKAAVWVSADGYVTFDPPENPLYSPWDVPALDGLQDFIAGLHTWYDYDYGGTVHVANVPVGGKPSFVVQYTDVPHWYGDSPVTFQIVLQSGTNDVRINLLDVPGGYHLIGMEDADGATGIVYKQGPQRYSQKSIVFKHPVLPHACEVPGPDEHGYTCLAVPHAFVDIRDVGSVVPLGLDDQHAIPIGFDFHYYGKWYSDVGIGSNGILSIPPSPEGGWWPDGRMLPDWHKPNGIVAGWFEDLEPQPGQVRTMLLGAPPTRTRIVQWTDVEPYWSLNGDAKATFQIVLHEGSNDIQVNFLDARDTGFSHTVGIEDPLGAVGVRFAHDTFSMVEKSIRFVAPPARPDATLCLTPVDAGGYVCTPSDYTWTPVQGSSVPVGNNGLSGGVPIGFPMSFYGQCYDKVYVSQHGYLTFDPSQTSSWTDGQLLPDPNEPNNLVAPYWAFGWGRSVTAEQRGTAPHRSLAVQWEEPRQWGSGGQLFQAILHEDGRIEFQYHHATPQWDYTYVAGIERAGGLAGSMYRYGSFVERERGVVFTPPPSLCGAVAAAAQAASTDVQQAPPLPPLSAAAALGLLPVVAWPRRTVRPPGAQAPRRQR